jgi:hypothetical protein
MAYVRVSYGKCSKKRGFWPCMCSVFWQASLVFGVPALCFKRGAYAAWPVKFCYLCSEAQP